MFTAFALVIALVLIGLAFVAPFGFVIAALLTGALPTSLGAEQVFSTPIGRLDVAALRLFAVMAGSMVVVLFHARRISPYLARVAPHLLFLLLCVVSLAYAAAPVYGLRMLAKLITPLLFLLALLVSTSTVRQLELVARAILASGISIVLLAVLTRIVGVNADPRFNLPGMGPSVFSAHLMIVCMLALATFSAARQRRLLVLAAVFIACIVAALTRITIVAVFVGASAIALLALQGPARVLLPLAGLVAGPALFLLSDRFRARMFIDAQGVSAGSVLQNPVDALVNVRGSGRFALWDDVLTRFYEPHPLFGSGIGTTQDFLYGSSGGIGVAHSEYVRLLCEVGSVGLLLFVVAMAWYGWRAAQGATRATDPQLRRYHWAAAGAVACYLVYIATDNGLDYVNQLGIYVFAMLGLSEKAREFVAVTTMTRPTAARRTPLPNLLQRPPIRLL